MTRLKIYSNIMVSRNNLKNTIVHFSNQNTLIESTGRLITIYKNDIKLRRIIKFTARNPIFS